MTTNPETTRTPLDIVLKLSYTPTATEHIFTLYKDDDAILRGKSTSKADIEYVGTLMMTTLMHTMAQIHLLDKKPAGNIYLDFECDGTDTHWIQQNR